MQIINQFNANNLKIICIKLILQGTSEKGVLVGTEEHVCNNPFVCGCELHRIAIFAGGLVMKTCFEFVHFID